MTDFQNEKRLILDFQKKFDKAEPELLTEILSDYVSHDYRWRGVHPFHKQDGVQAAVNVFWKPLRKAFTALRRRQDIFMAGINDADQGAGRWVCGMGHFMGLFDEPWLDIPPTKKIAFLRYAEFHRIEGGKIAESALFCDILSVMRQAGHYPLPPQAGAEFIHPGPATHDGMLYHDHAPEEAQKTLALINRMIADLSELNRSDDNRCSSELLARTWHEDMIWYGPTGIGATYTIPRYQQQHQHPFRLNLTGKVFNGHVCRFAEGNYAGFFGWPNLTNTPTGGFLGLPGNSGRHDMRVVDIYRRDGEKLAENWVFIDLLHYLAMQGLDVLKRMRELNGVSP